MNPEVKVFESSEGNVWKYVFNFGDAITEAVLYRYGSFEQRTVLCVSVQSGCPVGCAFCCTGNQFFRNLTTQEICYQVHYILENHGIAMQVNDNHMLKFPIEKFQIMFMSMGEPFLNYENVVKSIYLLTHYYTSAQLLVSTIAPKTVENLKGFIDLSRRIGNVGLQFSIHRSSDCDRDELIPFRNKLTLNEIRNYGIEWWKETGRKPYCNYCLDGSNATEMDFMRLVNRFPQNVFCFTFSVVCSSDENMKEASYRELDMIREFESLFIEEGYDTRVFDPAGQDDIGGGCGQLWYVQKWMSER
jgi:23S rRNA (adenine2503-C2)-methyltransferase